MAARLWDILMDLLRREGPRASESPRPDSERGLCATCPPVAAEKNTQLRPCAWSTVWGLQAAVRVLGVQGLSWDPTACSALRGVQWGAGQHPPVELRCERRWSPALARGWRGGGGAPAHVGQGEAALRRLAVSHCSRGAQRSHLGGLGHGARGEVREAAWCQWMAFAGGSGCPLLSEGGPGVLPLLALGRRSLGFGAEGRRLQLALGTHPGSGDPGVHTLWPGSPGPAPCPALLEE